MRWLHSLKCGTAKSKFGAWGSEVGTTVGTTESVSRDYYWEGPGPSQCKILAKFGVLGRIRIPFNRIIDSGFFRADVRGGTRRHPKLFIGFQLKNSDFQALSQIHRFLIGFWLQKQRFSGHGPDSSIFNRILIKIQRFSGPVPDPSIFHRILIKKQRFSGPVPDPSILHRILIKKTTIFRPCPDVITFSSDFK